MRFKHTILILLSALSSLSAQQVTQAASAGNETGPRAFSSVFTAHGQVIIEGYGPANKARVVGCGADSWTDSNGKFVISGKVAAGDYLGCSIQIDLPGCQAQLLPLTAPAGSVDLGIVILKPEIAGATTGTVSFLSIQAPPDVKKLKARAQQHAQKSEWGQALKTLESAVGKYENDPEAWLGIGIAQRRLAEPAKARAAFEKAATLDPRFALPSVELSLIALQDKDWPRAIQHGQNVTATYPEAFPEVRLYLATAYLNTANFTAAEAEARNVLASKPPTNPKAHHLLGVALAKQDRIPEAIAEFQFFIEKSPNTPDADLVRKHIQMLQGQK